jgi:hypothetical protein
MIAKSEIHAIHVWHAVENLTNQPAGHRENDFAISISFGERQVMAQLVASRLLVFSLAEEDFRVCHPHSLR